MLLILTTLNCVMVRNNNTNSPTTPEDNRNQSQREDHLQRLQMTDPDERCEALRQRQQLPQPDFLANLAAAIPQVEIPASIYAPRCFPMSIVSSALAPAPVIQTSAVGSTPLLAAIPDLLDGMLL